MARAINDDEQLEEERRLMYVALTRPRNHLAVTCPLNSYSTRRGADYSIDQMSRFLDRGVRDKMERVVPKFDGSVEPTPEAPLPAQLDLRAMLRGRFGM
jgi:DNA helicase-2/ATP-dependent DNA helicase PcrA